MSKSNKKVTAKKATMVKAEGSVPEAETTVVEEAPKGAPEASPEEEAPEQPQPEEQPEQTDVENQATEGEGQVQGAPADVAEAEVIDDTSGGVDEGSCAIDKCNEETPEYDLMCSRHTAAIPSKLRIDYGRALGLHARGFASKDEIDKVQRACIQAVQAQESVDA